MSADAPGAPPAAVGGTAVGGTAVGGTAVGGTAVGGAAVDLLGWELTAAEAAVLDAYHGLRSALARDDLPPSAQANLRHALAYAAVAVTDLALVFEHLTDEEV